MAAKEEEVKEQTEHESLLALSVGVALVASAALNLEEYYKTTGTPAEKEFFGTLDMATCDVITACDLLEELLGKEVQNIRKVTSKVKEILCKETQRKSYLKTLETDTTTQGGN